MFHAFTLVFAFVVPSTENSITNSADLNRHLDRQCESNLAFSISGTVLFPNNRICRTFTVEDNTDATRIADAAFWPNCRLQSGDRISASGSLVKNADGEIAALADHIKIHSHTTAPEPRAVTARELIKGDFGYRLIEVRGTILDAFRDEIDPRFAFFVLDSDRIPLYGSFAFDDDESQISSLIGAEVVVRGSFCPCFLGSRRLLGRQICLTSMDSIHVVKPAPADPFSAGSLYETTDDIIYNQTPILRKRISGRVIAVWDYDRFLVKSDRGLLSTIQTVDTPTPVCGDLVDVVGHPETDLFRLNLSNAHWRKTGHTAPQADGQGETISIRELTTDKHGRPAFKSSYHGKPIRITGKVLAKSPAEAPFRINLESDGFSVVVIAEACKALFDKIHSGCKITVSGICIMESTNWRLQNPFPHIESLKIVTRSDEDITIISSPSWWTPFRLLMLIAALIVLSAVSLAWNRILGRRIERRSRELMRERLAHEYDELKIQERTRLATELHDSVAQDLNGIAMQLDAARRLARTDPNKMLVVIDATAHTLAACRAELKNCLWDLRSCTLDETNLNEAVRKAVLPHIGEARLVTDLRIVRSRISDNTTHAMLCVIRELCSNAVRHGHASEISISGYGEPSFIHFEVTDNGTGFDPLAVPGSAAGHFGLQGIRERLVPFNGTISIDSHPGGNTIISVTMRKLQGQEETA